MIKIILTLAALLLPNYAVGAIVSAPDIKMIIDTKKVAYIYDTVSPKTYLKFKKQMTVTKAYPGDRLIIIKSHGGYVMYGDKMLKLIEEEKKAGIRIVCYVEQYASSMAFNILTNCDVRLSSKNAMMLVHKIRFPEFNAQNVTAKFLRKYADDLDRDDERFRLANSKAMGLTLEEYDNFADKETTWQAKTLVKRGYLNATATYSE